MAIPQKRPKPKTHPARMILRTNISQRRTHRKVTAEIGATAFLAGRSRHPISSAKELAALQRFNQLGRFKQLVAKGTNQHNAARQCGLGRTSAWRWLKRLEAGGLAALSPRTDRCGRPGIAEQCGLTPALVKQLQSACIVAGNISAGFKLFARSPNCPPPLTQVIRRAKTLPPSLRRLVDLRPVKLIGVQAGNQIVLTQQGGRA